MVVFTKKQNGNIILAKKNVELISSLPLKKFFSDPIK